MLWPCDYRFRHDHSEALYAVDRVETYFFMTVIDGVLCLDLNLRARVMYKRETLSVVTLE